MSIRGQLKLAMVFFYLLWVFAFISDGPLEVRAAAIIVTVGIFAFLVGTRRRSQ